MLSVEGKGDQTLLLRRSISDPLQSLRGPLWDSDIKSVDTDYQITDYFVDVGAADANHDSSDDDNSIQTDGVIEMIRVNCLTD